MSKPRNGSGSISDVISNYRRKQQWADRLLPFAWIGVILLMTGIGYLVYRFRPSNPPLQALDETQKVSPTVARSTPLATTLAPAMSEPTEQAGTPEPSEAPAATIVITYTVQQGDTLAGIAERYGVGLPALEALNPLVTPEFLVVGDHLSIPAQGEGSTANTPAPPGTQTYVEYQVAAGDTLAGIAAHFGSTIQAIVNENNLESPDQIQVGQTLRIPVEGGALPAATPAQPISTPELTPTPAP